MAVRHFAFVFKPELLARALAPCLSPAGDFSFSGLKTMAQAVPHMQNPVVQDALIGLRYDRGWLADDADEAERHEKWFVLALVGHLQRAPALATEDIVNLIELAEGDDTAKGFVYGDDLATLLAECGLEPWREAFASLKDFGGWLSLARLEALERTLAMHKPSTQANQRALEVLRYALHRQSALFVLID